MKALRHIACVGVLLAVFFAAPLLAFANVPAIAAKLSGANPDLISSATTIQASPDGRFYILLNTRNHAEENVAKWRIFFEGKEDAPLIMEDVSAVVVDSDAAGIEMAESLQSRLAENQMKLRREQAPLALSKADQGLFDVLVLSEDAYAAYGGQTVASLGYVEVIER